MKKAISIWSFPFDWPLERKINYFTWAGKVVSGLRGVNMPLETAFDRVYNQGMTMFRDAPNLGECSRATS